MPAPASEYPQTSGTSHPHSTEATGLRRHAEQLAAQNTKLQWDVKLAEELNVHLAEETTQLKAQLRWCGIGAGQGWGLPHTIPAPRGCGGGGRWWVLGWLATPLPVGAHPRGGGRSRLLGSWTAPKRWCLAVPGSSQQALEQARATAEELEDLKAMAKGLEEENSELRQQARQLVRGPASSLPVSPQLPPRCQAGPRGTSSEPHVFPPQEKEQRCLSSQANNLQEEVRTPPGAMGKGACPGSAGVVVNARPFCPKQNQRLVAEGRGLRQRIQALSAEMADLEVSGVGGVHTAWPMPSASLSANKAGVCPPAPPSLPPCRVAQLPAHPLANATSSLCQAQLSRCTVLLSSRDVALAQVSTTRGCTQLWPPLRQPSGHPLVPSRGQRHPPRPCAPSPPPLFRRRGCG